MTHTLTRTGGAYVGAKRHDRANSTNTKAWCQKQKRKQKELKKIENASTTRAKAHVWASQLTHKHTTVLKKP